MGIEWKVVLTTSGTERVEVIECFETLEALLMEARTGAWESFEGFGLPLNEINWAEDDETKAVLVTFLLGPDGVLRESYPNGEMIATPMPPLYRRFHGLDPADPQEEMYARVALEQDLTDRTRAMLHAQATKLGMSEGTTWYVLDGTLYGDVSYTQIDKFDFHEACAKFKAETGRCPWWTTPESAHVGASGSDPGDDPDYAGY